MEDVTPAWVRHEKRKKKVSLRDRVPKKRTERKPEEPKPVLMTMEHLKGFKTSDANALMTTSTTKEEAESARQPLLEILERAGLQVDEEVMRLLPTWKQVTDLYGEKPVFWGKDSCEVFRRSVPKQNRFVGVAGQFNTGTNALFKYLDQNMQIKENKMFNGVLWTIPWYKHAWVDLRYRYMYRKPDEHSNVFPIIMIRDPYFWMRR